VRSKTDSLLVTIGILAFFVGRWTKTKHKELEINVQAPLPPEDSDGWQGYIDEETYREHRRILIDGQGQAAQDFDKYLVALSAGAFGLSLAFIRQIAPDPVMLWSIITAWIAFGLSLLAILTSFLISQSAFQRAVEILDKQNEEDIEDSNKLDSVTTGLNVVSIVSVVVGVASLGYFAISNIGTSV
jgi:hypothetical protein